MPEDRESRASALIVKEIVESNPNEDWELKCIQYDATEKEAKQFRKGSRFRLGLVDVLQYDQRVLRGNCNAQTSLYPPMFSKKGCKCQNSAFSTMISCTVHADLFC